MISLLLIDVQGVPQRSWQTHVFCLQERLLEGGMGWHGLSAAGLCQPAKRVWWLNGYQTVEGGFDRYRGQYGPEAEANETVAMAAGP